MLKKRERLTTAAFDRAFKSGRRHHSDVLTLVYSPSEAFHGAVVVGKKVASKAVARNKLRRRIYNALYALRQEQDLQGTYIVLTKPGAVTQSHGELKETLASLIGRTRNSR